MEYRNHLYTDYSKHFGKRKGFDPSLQLATFPSIYRDLPEDREIRIADLGCGKGEWLAWMKGRGFRNLTGIDVSANELAHLKNEDITLIEGGATERLTDEPGAFDLLHAKDVIEHLTKDETIEFLTACRRSLKPKGTLWLCTFNAQSPFAAATRYGDFTHESGLTPVSLAQILRATGFREIGVRGFHACSQTWKGKLRSAAYRPVEIGSRLILKLRHGGGAHEPGIDAFSAKPDLFASARV